MNTSASTFCSLSPEQLQQRREALIPNKNFAFLPLWIASLSIALRAVGADEVGGWKPVAYPHRNTETGVCSLKVNDFLLHQFGKARTVGMISLWQFDPDIKKWAKLKRKVPPPVAIRPIKREVYSTKTDTVLFELTSDTGLFWVKWKEDDQTVGRELFSGTILCNDIDIGKPPEGMTATCVPFKDHASAMFVPDPKTYCVD